MVGKGVGRRLGFAAMEFLFGCLVVVRVVYCNPIFKGRTFRNTVLLLASLAFYGWGEPVFVFLMMLSILMTWFVGLRMDRSDGHKKNWLTVGIGLHVLLLFVFKYVSFLSKELSELLSADWLRINISLPIGISFFTFQLMSYLFDVYYGKTKVQKNLAWLALYVSLFPQLIAGPIVRYEQIADEILNRRENKADFVAGIQRFVYGMAKKLLISNYVAVLTDNIFSLSASQSISVMSAWLGAISYALQIYFDFSGYSDMAIGLGQMCGFHFWENFNYPYVSKSITEFWSRWHISLGTWFRDYVYIPLGGSRVSKGKHVRNIFLVWLLTGIWHGANWTFVVWGLYSFALLMLEKNLKFTDRLGWFSHVYAMVFVIIGSTIFRAESLGLALRYLGQMFGLGEARLPTRCFGRLCKAER